MAQDTIHKIIEITIKNSDLIEKMRESQNAIGALSNETKQLKQDLEEYRKSLKEGKITQEQFDRMMIQTKNEIIKNDQAVVNSSRISGNIRGRCSRISGKTPQKPDR